jgi:exodeoxyribonuclease VII small subunit
MEKEIKEMSFEEALVKLETIVNELEDEKIALEESIKRFELGVKLSSHCLAKLDEAEKKIEELTRSQDGKLVTKELKLDDL